MSINIWKNKKLILISRNNPKTNYINQRLIPSKKNYQNKMHKFSYTKNKYKT